MKSLYLRIWLTVVAALAVFALVAGWLVRNHLEQERLRAEAVLAERMAAWGELIEASLPLGNTPADQQAEALREWSRRLRVPLALDDGQGQRIAASDSFIRREADGPSQRRTVAIRLSDGRTLHMMRPALGKFGRPGGPPPVLIAPPQGGASSARPGDPPPALLPDFGPDGPPLGDGRERREGGPGPGPMGEGFPGDGLRGEGPRGDGPREDGLRGDGPPDLPSPERGALIALSQSSWWDWSGVGVLALSGLLFLAIAAGAYPVVRSLTRRLERLKQGVEAFGAGALGQRVAALGNDEVAALARSFNRAAERIETLVRSNQSLLANASHELRSPLARLKMAVAMLPDAPPALQDKLHREIHTNIAELDELVEEVLLSSRLEAGAAIDLDDPVDLLGLAAEEAARVGAALEVAGPEDAVHIVQGSERLLRRALRNLLENARRYGGPEVMVEVGPSGDGGRICRVCDRGPGVPEDQRERIFEPFYRMPGHAEREGGVGLGLALVRQIAQRHQGRVHCEPREGGGSCFVLRLPLKPVTGAPAPSA